jgi:hypothetical protein
VTRGGQVVGFDRTLELSWLDATVGFVIQGLEPAEVRKRVFAYLEGVVPGLTNNSARGKTATVLTRIWSKVAPSTVGLRNAALPLYVDGSPQERLALHWALTLAAYPYFLDAAAHIGRLLRLHGEMDVPQLTRRLSETWGQRELVQRTAQLASKSMSMWGVLRPLARPGAYRLAGRPLEIGPDVTPLLAEALLLGIGREALAASVIEVHPALFPFDVVLNGSALRHCDRLEVNRVGVNVDQVNLRAALT